MVDADRNGEAADAAFRPASAPPGDAVRREKRVRRGNLEQVETARARQDAAAGEPDRRHLAGGQRMLGEPAAGLRREVDRPV